MWCTGKHHAHGAPIAAADLAELSAPDYGLDTQVQARIHFGQDASLEFAFCQDHRSSHRWLNGKGEAIEQLPAKLQRRYLALYDLWVNRMAGASTFGRGFAVNFLERACQRQQVWTGEVWRTRYNHGHVLRLWMARRLIWRLTMDRQTLDVCWCEEGKGWSTLEGRRVDVGRATLVSLWHPFSDTAERVHAWRMWLKERSIEQPFAGLASSATACRR